MRGGCSPTSSNHTVRLRPAAAGASARMYRPTVLIVTGRTSSSCFNLRMRLSWLATDLPAAVTL